MTIDVINTTGKKIESISLPKDIFEVEVNDELLAQALRVHLANQHQGSKKTLTRGEVARTTAKVWRQKGTGRARHGSRKAPIFVGGGVAFGPNPESSPKLTLNKKSKRLALIGSLTRQAQAKNIIVLDSAKGFDAKTKTAQQIFKAVAGYNHLPADKILFVLPASNTDILRSSRNLPGITITQAKRMNIYEILNSQKLILTKDSIAAIKDALTANTKKEVTA